MRAFRTWWLPVLLALVAVVGAPGSVAVSATAGSGSWTSVWRDNFSGAAGNAPSAANWSLITGTSYPGGPPQWGTGEQETYTSDPANVGLDGSGHLRITATLDASGLWRSARLETNHTSFQPSTGGQLQVQARIETPNGGVGYWPAFWMLGGAFRGVYTNWPGVGEIDIMENSGLHPNRNHGTLHCGVTPGGPCHENSGLGGKYNAPYTLSAGFHTYTIVWDRSQPIEQISWYLDDHLYASVNSSHVDATTWANATHHGFFMVLNVAIGGSFAGSPDSTTRPGASMLVDYVRVSRR